MADSLIFGEITSTGFTNKFNTEEACLEHIAEAKWVNGYVCRKCGHAHYCRGKTPFSRRCTRCKHEESATSQTIFHRCKIPLPLAFQIVWHVCHHPGISSYELSDELQIRQMTCWKFKRKIADCIESRNDVSPEIKSQLRRIFEAPDLNA